MPLQPKVLMEIDRLSSQPRVNHKTIADLISCDAGLSAALFKIVNSPAMGLAQRINSIEGAIAVLGLKQLINIVKCTALRQSIGHGAPVDEKFRDRSSDIARLAALVAQKQGEYILDALSSGE